MGVNLAVAGIDHQPFVVRFVDQNLQQLFPDPFIAPANEATVCITPSTIVRWQIPPRRPRAQNPENRIDK